MKKKMKRLRPLEEDLQAKSQRFRAKGNGHVAMDKFVKANGTFWHEAAGSGDVYVPEHL